MPLVQARADPVPVATSKPARTVSRSILATAFVAAVGAGSAMAQGPGAEWRQDSEGVVAWLNPAQLSQWRTSGWAPLVQGHACIGGTYLGSATPSAGEQGISLFLVKCGRVPGLTSAMPPQGRVGACQVVRSFVQPAGPGSEAAIIHVMNCPGGQILIYEYVNRPGYRVIRPPNWGQAVGGHDLPTLADAVNVAGAGQPPPPRPSNALAPRLMTPLAAAPGAGNSCPPAYYLTQSVVNGPAVCLKCSTGTGNLGWFNGHKYCVTCPSGTHYDTQQYCVRN